MEPVYHTEPYTDLAEAYDYILRHVDYQEWYQYIRKVMERFTVDAKKVVELGCGTGRFGAKFSTDGFEIYGVDKSLEMLRVAKARAFKNFRIICADMAEFHLAKKADFIFSVHDTMNYFINKSDVRRVFSCVRNIMHEDSVFMFDITTEYNIESNFHDVTNTYEIRGRSVEWTNEFNRRRRMVLSTLRFFNRDGTAGVENHIQRIYSIGEIKKLLKKEGFEVLGIFGDYSFMPPSGTTVMINFVTRLA